MLRDDVLAHLCCPYCESGLGLAGRVVTCATGHAFDVARQGYLGLWGPQAPPGTADTAAMVAARERILSAGHLDGLVTAIAEASAGALMDRLPGPGCIVDVGAGTGRHLAAVLDRAPDRLGLALDAAKPALRRAARAHPRLGAVGCDAWGRLPVRTGTAALALSVFAPRNATELHRILRPRGVLVVVTPTAAHLHELVGPLGLLSVDARKDERLAAQLHGRFDELDRREVTARMTLSRREAVDVAAMGPSAWHTDPDRLTTAAQLLPEPAEVTAACTIRRYRRSAG
jgi:23S rRNA (guanine745-N1)-methyltransferase